MAANQTLREILVADLPHGFVEELKDHLARIYQESTARANNDSSWGEAGARYMRGHYRHVLSNETFRRLAAKYGFSVSLKKTETDSADFSLASIRRLSLTISHVKGKKIVPDRAHYREQYSKINSHLPQMQLFEDVSIDDGADFYAIICHGESSNGELGFVGFSFTNEKGNRVLDHIPVEDIAEIQLVQTQAVDERDQTLAEVQKVEPVLKKALRKKVG